MRGRSFWHPQSKAQKKSRAGGSLRPGEDALGGAKRKSARADEVTRGRCLGVVEHTRLRFPSSMSGRTCPRSPPGHNKLTYQCGWKRGPRSAGGGGCGNSDREGPPQQRRPSRSPTTANKSGWAAPSTKQTVAIHSGIPRSLLEHGLREERRGRSFATRNLESSGSLRPHKNTEESARGRTAKVTREIL
ncbi:hypothetical protein NEOLEDRAFT_1151204 [Neolentinus lepideus HHB14362 ss-1]|uniref:Uncharacterized protein n=1 Tax=Neolentinus lepideus HHB14362 ss-1 TaxID=1314782 RepID=A0A165P7D9_9AGAM|nr:hypothetical protein NEOLEDRAFT_1151204 [Neolentinus lepideus HHB14362 ss-1]